MNTEIKIAIDGPAGAGKSTIAKLLAQKLGLLYIDTGSMYRAVTLKALQLNFNFQDTASLAALSKQVKIELLPAAVGCRVMLDGKEVTREIRQPEVSRYVSLVAKIPEVRQNMVRQQQAIAAQGGIVMDGRDIGTRVLPDAKIKFFLTASVEERAKRRQLDLAQQGYQVELEKLITEIAERDTIDESRPVDPLVPAHDALVIDSTGLTIEQVINIMMEKIKQVYC